MLAGRRVACTHELLGPQKIVPSDFVSECEAGGLKLRCAVRIDKKRLQEASVAEQESLGQIIVCGVVFLRILTSFSGVVIQC